MSPRMGTRPEPRDTAEVLGELGITPRQLAIEVRRAEPSWSWKTLRDQIPVLVLLLGGFAAAAVRWDRTATRDDLAAAVDRVETVSQQQIRALELALAEREKQLIQLRGALDAERQETDRRLDLLEQPPARRRR